MAAGSSSRLGQPKQLIKITKQGKHPQSLLHRQIMLMDNMCLAFNAKAYCVLGFQSKIMTEHLTSCSTVQPFTLIDHDNWQQGLSSSIAKGVSVLIDEKDQNFSAVLIFFVDQWQLTVEHLTKLIAQWQQAPERIHLACCGEHFSPPAIFPQNFFTELKTLSGDDGAKIVIKNNSRQVNSITMPSAFVDLDTPEQLEGFINETNDK